MRLRLAYRTLVLLAAAVLALSACSGESGETPGAGAGGGTGSIKMLSPEPTQGLDPNIAAADASRGLMGMIYETLTELDENGDLVGSLADSWEISPDGLTYTFKLRQGVKFSDGSPITASDVKFSVERMQQGEIMKGLLKGLKSTEVVDDGTVRFSLSAPSRIFPSTLGRPGNAAILSERAVASSADYFTKPTATSGPWQLTDYVTKSHATLTANPNYYNVPKLSPIEYSFSEDQTAHAAAIESGSADIASIGYNDVDRLKQGGVVQIVQADRLAPLFWGWDRTKAPFDDKRVRQAVAFAVDRTGRQTACWFNTGGITYGNVLRPWDPAYVELNNYRTASRQESLAKATALLDQAGWRQGPDGVRVASGVKGIADGAKLEVRVPYEGNWPAAECHVQLLQQNLKEVGIAVTPQKYDPAAYWGDVAKGKFVMYHGGAGAEDADDLYVNWFHSGGSLTALTTHLDDKAIDAKVDEALATTDEAASKQIYQDLERWQADELPLLVVGYQWPQSAVSQRVKNYRAPLDIDSRALVQASVG
jgi:peptide/nickel transport system substrate-binding protein